MEYTVEQIATKVGGVVKGEYRGVVRGIGALDKAGEGNLSFLGNKKYRDQVTSSVASVILLPEDYEGAPREGQAYLFVKNPSMALAVICKEVEAAMLQTMRPGIHALAVIAATAAVSNEAYVGPFCSVGEGSVIGKGTVLRSHVAVGNFVKIGHNTTLMPHVSVYDYSEIGNGVLIHSGAVIGSDGFGFETVNGVHEKVPQIGRVCIEDNVEIGANTTIDRARFDTTRVGRGSKIDNLVQIAHNVQIGKGCIVAGQAGISGSTTLEDYVVLAGQVGLAGHINIGAQVVIGAQSGVNHDIPAKTLVRGTPAVPYMQAQRIDVIKLKLPELYKRLQAVEQKTGLTRPL